jgi:hypothetical protein
MKKIYISVPMSGKDLSEQELKSRKAEIKLLKSGFDVVNPFDLVPEVETPSYEDYMKKDLEALKECTAILLCPEWNMSNGCKRELKQALEDGLHIMVD